MRASFTSDLVPVPVDYAVLAPQGFRKRTDLPLVLNLHGGRGSRDNLFAQAGTWDALWASGTIEPAIVVMPTVAERGFYMNTLDGSERWEDLLLGPFLEHLRTTLPATTKPRRTFVIGVSMGGMGALRMAFRRPDLFGAVAAIEPGIAPVLVFADLRPKHRFWRGDELFRNAYGDPVDARYWAANHPPAMAIERRDPIVSSGLAIYLEAGDEDQFYLYEGAEFLHQVLWRERIRHEYHLVRGADHVGASMGERLDEAVRFLFRSLTPWPTTARSRQVDALLDPLKAGLDELDHYRERAPER
jgi:S-formylglutathione hydrolase